MALVTTASRAYIHPHHGGAVRDGAPVKRVVGGRTVEMQALLVPAAPSWSYLVGQQGAVLATSHEVQILVPTDMLEDGGTLWARCPDMDIDAIIEMVLERSVAPWETRIEVPAPMKMINRCKSVLGDIAVADSINDQVAELIVQIGDYLTLWHLGWLFNTYDNSAKRVGAEVAFKKALRSGEDFWSDEIAQTYTMKAHGRELIVVLARVASIVAVGSGMDVRDVAARINVALSERTVAQNRALRAAARASRGSDKNAA